jgi:16S rRNA processing protein RimM
LTKRFLPLGEVVGTHGLRGELRVKPLCNGVDFARRFSVIYWDENGEEPVSPVSVRQHKNVLLFVLQGITSLEQAEKLRGRRLWFRRQDVELESGEAFVAELLGCKALDADTGEEYGVVTEVTPLPANDVWHIRGKGGKEYLFPAVAAMLAEIDTAGGVVRLRPIGGIFDGNED